MKAAVAEVTGASPTARGLSFNVPVGWRRFAPTNTRPQEMLILENISRTGRITVTQGPITPENADSDLNDLTRN